MSEERPAAGARCPQCGAEVPRTAPDGLCPKCLAAMSRSLLGLPAGKQDEPRPEPSPPLVPGPPRRFGDYELLSEIARGGMGAVYRARQVSLNRIVALKLLLFGRFASDSFVKRFRAEAEAVALLRHPNIVAIHEVGEQDGQHYFSMDFVEGCDLSEFMRTGPLTAKQSAVHLRTMAEAIDYAHRQGILHRDLKPSNVLIDPQGELHITDFGLAKRLDGGGDLTVTGHLLGSPNFMPPEQADPQRGDAGPASDVYSLGAILYHLLTGRPPFVAETFEGTLLRLLNEDPVDPRLLNPAIPADLATLCLKCLEKDPGKRYPTARALADELGRYLSGEPILARPVGAAERLWRWTRREPLLAGLTFGLGAALLGGLTVTSLLLWRERDARQKAWNAEQTQRQLRTQAEEERRAATSEAAKSRQLAEFLQQMLTRAGPSASLGRDTALLRDILDQAAMRLDAVLTNQPSVAADLKDVIGRTYRDIGDLPKSISLHREAWQLRRALREDKAPTGAMTLSLLAQALTEHDELDEAEKLIDEALALWKSLAGPADSKVAQGLTCLGSVYFRRGNLPRARECYGQAIAILRANRDPAVYSPLNNLANVLTVQKDFAGAEKTYREAMAAARKQYGDLHPATALLLRNLGDVLNAQGKLDEASATHAEALATRIQLLDEVHPLVADSFERLGVVASRQGKWPEAETFLRKAIAIRRKLSPDDPRQWDDDANSLADSLNAQGRFEDSVNVLTELISSVRDNEPGAARLYAIRGSARGRSGRWAEAAGDLERALRLDPTVEWHSYLLAPLLLETRQLAAYQTLCRDSLARFAEAEGDTASRVALMALLHPDSTIDLRAAHGLVDRALANGESRGGQAYHAMTKALAELRSHEPAKAINRIKATLENVSAGRWQGGRFLRVQGNALLALAHHALGQTAEAREALHRARTVAPAKTEIPPRGDYGSWHEWLILQIHLREAGFLIEGETRPAGSHPAR